MEVILLIFGQFSIAHYSGQKRCSSEYASGYQETCMDRAGARRCPQNTSEGRGRSIAPVKKSLNHFIHFQLQNIAPYSI
jgi:hypothetical protein